MRIKEIMENASAGASSAGSIAAVSKPLLTQSRAGSNLLTGKYTTVEAPNTPEEYKRKKNVSGRFKNSIGK